MKIYGSFTSPFVRHCRIVLLQTALPCEFVETDIQQIGKISPTQKLPLLIDGDLMLTDSSSILKYLREKSGAVFMSDLYDFELFNMSNTLMDASVNLYVMDLMDNITPEKSKYLQRQQSRILSGLEALNEYDFEACEGLTDGKLRLACFLDWGIYRDMINLKQLNNLSRFLDSVREDINFIKTCPPM
ncbi:glutathione S-transferase domain-containing protein [Psychromonas sp. CNPT3]|uniref:glutathione S-transferase family protein n=1 Tax=Psychromonas sp. CNPT3 TaxID=314282 RepID=UPI00006E5380|nr:glutathione S-transferase [Psychromonas sp. CNPT3]AGH81564.1 glutathione S-transferase domain-containing protein [Psychromonas sp. CNPT3]